jgi:hypothetical protein
MYNVDTAIYSNLKHFLVDDTPPPFPSSIIAHKRGVAARWFAESAETLWLTHHKRCHSRMSHAGSRIANGVKLKIFNTQIFNLLE